MASRKTELAFSLGGMGTATANFYNDAYSRQGWAEVAARVRDRWQSGDRDGAAALVTDDMVLATTLIGTEDMVRARLRTWRDAGVDTVRLYPAGDTPTARLDTLARGIDLVRVPGLGGSGCYNGGHALHGDREVPPRARAGLPAGGRTRADAARRHCATWTAGSSTTTGSTGASS